MANKPTPPKPVVVTEPGRTRPGLAGLIENTLIRWVQLALDGVKEALSETLEYGIEITLEAVEEALVDVNRGYIGFLVAHMGPDNPARPYFEALLAPTSQGQLAALAGFAGSMGSSAAGNLLNVVLRPFGYELDGVMHTARLPAEQGIVAKWRNLAYADTAEMHAKDLGWDPRTVDIIEEILRPVLAEGDLAGAYFRKIIGPEQFKEMLHWKGYRPEIANLIEAVSRPLIPAEDASRLYLRGSIGEGAMVDAITAHGYTPQQADLFMKLLYQLTPVNELVALAFRDPARMGALADRLGQHGFQPAQVEEIVKAARPLTNVGDLTRLAWREKLLEGSFSDRLKQIGFTDTQAAEFEELSKQIPGPADLISMAVREAFDEKFIAQYGYASGLPEDFVDAMGKQGYTEAWARRYWIAHWKLPSIEMAFEMLHRRKIGPEDIERLLIAADIAPVWRKPITEISYQPLTRVDVRRMYHLGVLGETAVFDAYRDLGYSDVNAKHMLDFTMKYEVGAEKEATKADIMKGYRTGVLSPGATESALAALGYAHEWASYFMALEDVKAQEELDNMALDLIQTQYVEGQIDRGTAFARFGALDLPSGEADYLMARWDIAREKQVAIPGALDLEAWLKQGIISDGVYSAQMARRHWRPEDISSSLRSIHLEIAAAALAAERAARAEVERVAAKVGKTEYDVATSDLTVQIMEIKRAMAENAVLSWELTTVEEIDALSRQNVAMKLRIAELNKGVAQAKLAYSQQLRGMGG